MGIADSQLGGTFTGVTFPPTTTYYEGCTFIAACVIPPGSILVNCDFQPLRTCGTFGKSACSGLHSTVGEGAIATGGFASFVEFESSGRISGMGQGEEATMPDCVDCAPWGERGVAVDVTGTYIVSGGEYRTLSDACTDRCTDNGILIMNVGDASVECTTGDLTVSG